MAFPRFELIWLLLASTYQLRCRRISVRVDRKDLANRRVVAIDWDETLTRVSVMPKEFRSGPDKRLNYPTKLMNRLMYVEKPSFSSAPRIQDHLWFEFAGVYDKLESDDPQATSASRAIALPSRVSKLHGFLQRLVDSENVTVVVLSNTRFGPQALVTKLKLLGLDGFFDGVFAGLPADDPWKARMMYMRNKGGKWYPPFEVMADYDFDKTRVLNLLIEYPRKYIGEEYFGFRRKMTPRWLRTAILAQDVLLIDDLEENCEAAEKAGFQSYHVKRTTPMQPETQRAAAGFGAGLDFYRDFGCYAGSPLALLSLCQGQQETWSDESMGWSFP